MIRTIAKLWAYKKAPKATYIARHPIQGTKMWLTAKAAKKGAKSLVTSRTGLVLGAVAAIPVGLWATSQLSS
jgi:ABC-type phosphate/phosphonate transport system permease subunit